MAPPSRRVHVYTKMNLNAVACGHMNSMDAFGLLLIFEEETCCLLPQYWIFGTVYHPSFVLGSFELIFNFIICILQHYCPRVLLAILDPQANTVVSPFPSYQEEV